MLTTFFTGVLQLSIQGSVLILLVLCLRKLLHRIGAPRILNTFLWCAVLFQLLCPLRIPVSLFSVEAPNISNTVTALVNEAIISESALSTVMVEAAAQETVSEHAAQVSSPAGTFLLLVANYNFVLVLCAVVWLIGSLVFIFRGIAQYDFLRRHVRLAYRVQEHRRVYYTGTGVSTPFILGIFKPRIYLPPLTDSTEKAYIYRHEQAHLAHGDFLLKPLFYLALSIHWFNPLVWLAMQQMARDIETACDETVLACFDTEIKPHYCKSLLRFAHAPRYATMPLCFGEGDFTKRIKDILNYRKPRFWAICSGVMLAGIVCVVCVVNPFASSEHNALTTADDIATDSAIADSATTTQGANSSVAASTQAADASNTTPEATIAPDLSPAPEATIAPEAALTPATSPTPAATTVPDVLLGVVIDSTSNPTEDTISIQERLEALNLDPITINLMWPVPEYSYVSEWYSETHSGVDIVADAGTPVYAAADGVVVCAGYGAVGTGYGYSILIDHGDGFQTVYAHGLSCEVSEGDIVSQGDYIMPIGSSGYSTGNHLHFELRFDEMTLDLNQLFTTVKTSETPQESEMESSS